MINIDRFITLSNTRFTASTSAHDDLSPSWFQLPHNQIHNVLVKVLETSVLETPIPHYC